MPLEQAVQEWLEREVDTQLRSLDFTQSVGSRKPVHTLHQEGARSNLSFRIVSLTAV